MDELIDELCALLEIKESHVSRLTPQIFICGGEMSQDPTTYSSIRDYFYKKIEIEHPDLFKRLVLAEDINQWFGDRYYDELLDLEKDLAGLVAGLPIFVESAGSLAELGAFSVIPEISKKLLVFISSDYWKTQSFVWLGPLKKIEEDKIRPYEFKKSNPDHYTADDFVENSELIIEDIINNCKPSGYNRNFKPDDIAHLILLISDLVFIGVLLKKNEISRMLHKTLEYEVPISKISKCLWVAEKMGMLRIVEKYGDIYYHVPLNTNGEYISFSFKDGTGNEKKDRLKWRADFLEIIEKDSRRKKALKGIIDDQ